jgi:PAS domain S-box-containing protein
MSKPYPFLRIFRCVTIALILALALEGLRQIASFGFSGWASHIVASLLGASVVLTLTFGLLWNLSFKAASDPAAATIAQTSALDTIPEEQREAEFFGIPGDIRELCQAQRNLRESEEQYRLLVATIPEVVWKTDAKGNVLFVSPQVEKLLGYTADEFRDHGDSLWFNSVHVDDKERVGQAFESLVKEGKPYDIVCRARKRNGEWLWAHDRAVATLDSNGSRVATGLISDITSRIAGEEGEKRYRSLFENMLEGFAHCEMLFDDGGRPIDFVYLDVNHAFAKLTGLQNVVGRRFTEVIPGGEDSNPELLEAYGRVVLTGKPESFEIEIKALGMWFFVSPYSAGKGCFGVTFENITERKQIEQTLRQAEEKYRTIFQGAAVGIFQSTPGGRYTTVNPALAHMLGYDSPEEMVASITDISHQIYVDPQKREEMKRLLTEHGMVKNFEFAVYRKDSSKMWFSANARAVSEDGVVVGYEGTNEDITAQKAAEERIQFLAYYDALT